GSIDGAPLRICAAGPIVGVDGVSATHQAFAYREANPSLTHHDQISRAPQQGGDQQLEWRRECVGLCASSVEHEYPGKRSQLPIAQTGRDNIGAADLRSFRAGASPVLATPHHLMS